MTGSVYTLSMVATLATAALVLAAANASAAERPAKAPGAYRAVEKLSDGAYNVLRGTLFSAVLPSRLTRHMGRVPKTDSYEAFRGRLSRMGPITPARDSREAANERLNSVRDAFISTLVDRYKLELFGKKSGDYALDTKNWEPGFLLSAGVLGSAYLWAAGVDAGIDAGPARLELGLAPGWRWRAASAGGSGRRLARAELSPRNSSLALKAEWGDSGPMAETVGVSWTRRF